MVQSIREIIGKILSAIEASRLYADRKFTGAVTVLLLLAGFPAQTFAQVPLSSSHVYDTIYLSGPLELARGTLVDAAPGARFLGGQQSCNWLRTEWHWNETLCADVEAIVFDFLPSVQTLLVYRPKSEGLVRFDDWYDDDRDTEVDQIWRDTARGLRERGGEVGMSIVPRRWRVSPELDARKAQLFYVMELRRDGTDILFLRAAQFDRRGHVSFMLVPSRPDYSDAELARIMSDVLDRYRPAAGEAYYDAQRGDAVSVVGPFGVLAGLMGVQHAKTVMAVAIADAMARAKQYWYLSFLSIALFARRIFRRSAAA